MKRRDYITPTAEISEIAVELGFAQSLQQQEPAPWEDL